MSAGSTPGRQTRQPAKEPDDSPVLPCTSVRMLVRLLLLTLLSAGGGLALGLGDITPQAEGGGAINSNSVLQNTISRILCSLTTCDVNTFCQLGQCWPRLPTGAVCANDQVCVSGLCVNGQCSAGFSISRPVAANLASPLAPIIIRLPSFLKRTTTTAAPGAPGGGGGVTTAAPPVTTTTSITCLRAPTCDPATTFCDTADGMCKPRLTAGLACVSNDQCTTRLCLATLVCACLVNADCMAPTPTCNLPTMTCQ